MSAQDDQAKVMAANDAFYQAFSSGDFPAMDVLWARDTPVACVHPGWRALRTRDDVMRSWRSVLGSDARPEVRAVGAVATVVGDTAWVTCYEQVSADAGRATGVLAATNVFVRETGAWRMVHHHAGPIASVEPEPASRTSSPRRTRGPMN